MDFEALLAKATPGPWAWFGNARNNDLYLATVRCGRQYVMGFQRWGMREAQPTFRFKGRLVPASDRLKFEVGDQAVTGVKAAKADESVYRQDIRDIDAPDAQLIVAAVNALPDLLAENKARRARALAAEADAQRCREALERLRVLSREATQGEWGTGGTFMPNSECPRTSIWGPTPAGMQSGAWIAKDIIPADADLAIAAVAFVRSLLGEGK